MEKEIPLYQMIYNKIVNRILVGLYPQGYQLLSVNKIHAQCDIGYNSIRRSMQMLQAEGFISCEGRKAPTVVFDAKTPECQALRHHIFLSRCQAHLDCYNAIPYLIPGLVIAGAKKIPSDKLKELEVFCQNTNQFHTRHDLLKHVYSWQKKLVSYSENSLANDLFLQIHGFDDLRFIVMQSSPLMPGESDTILYTLHFWNTLIKEKAFSKLYIMQALFCKHAYHFLQHEFEPYLKEKETSNIRSVDFRWYVQQSPVPLYKKIAFDLLRHAYLTKMQPGDYFLSENQLMKQYQVAAVTVRGAISYLNQIGITKTQNGIGTYFTGSCTNAEEQNSSLHDCLECISILSECSYSLAYAAAPLLSDDEIDRFSCRLSSCITQDQFLLQLMQTFVHVLSNSALEAVFEQLESRLIIGLILRQTFLDTDDPTKSVQQASTLCSLLREHKIDSFALLVSDIWKQDSDRLIALLNS